VVLVCIALYVFYESIMFSVFSYITARLIGLQLYNERNGGARRTPEEIEEQGNRRVEALRARMAAEEEARRAAVAMEELRAIPTAPALNHPPRQPETAIVIAGEIIIEEPLVESNGIPINADTLGYHPE